MEQSLPLFAAGGNRVMLSVMMVVQDKAVKRFTVRNIVEQAAVRDVQEACIYEGKRALSIPLARRDGP